jgi:hypothetical protein
MPASPQPVVTSNRLRPQSVLSGVTTATNTLTATVAAGTSLIVSLSGNQFYFTGLTDAVDVRAITANGAAQFNTYSQGMGLLLSSGAYFNSLEIRNGTGNAVTFTLIAGVDSVIDKRVIIDKTAGSIPTATPATLLVGSNVTSIAGGSMVVLSGAALPTARKQVIVSNNDNAASLDILDSSNRVFASVQPGLAWTIETTDVIKVRNSSGNAIAANIGEIYYQS